MERSLEQLRINFLNPLDIHHLSSSLDILMQIPMFRCRRRCKLVVCWVMPNRICSHHTALHAKSSRRNKYESRQKLP